MLKKVIITDHLHPYLEQQLTKLGYEVDVQQDITNEQLFEIIDQYFGLVLSTKIKVTSALLDKATKLVFIARAGSGME
nr:hydroxyacid dehydrogenase [Chitinophagales bacterium]